MRRSHMVTVNGNGGKRSLPADAIGGSVLPTEGIKYVGSKQKLLPHILDLAAKTGARSVLDGFAGTTRVSQAFARSGYRVVANDTAVWSKVLGTCYLLNDRPRRRYEDLIAHLNALSGRDGWFTEHYGGRADGGSAVQSDAMKRPWQIHNTRRLDAIREEIDNLSLDAVERAVALTSLIRALDEVDNTLGHFASYLKDWSARSYRRLELKVPNVLVNRAGHEVHQRDVFELTGRTDIDLAYFDPPYGSNNEKMPPSRVRYAAYYHLWTSVCLFDRPALFGRAGRRVDTSDRLAASPFEAFRRNDAGRFIAVEAMERLLKAVRCRYVILSYSSGGRATADELNEAIRASGRLRDVIEVEHRRNVMATMRWTNEWVRDADVPNQEFLFLIEK